MVAGALPFICSPKVKLELMCVYYYVWGVAAMNCTVWLWSGMALNIWVCSQDKMCPTVMCLSGYIVYICHYAYSYLFNM